METNDKIAELTAAGLSPEQAEVYITLLQRGTSTASQLSTRTTLSRPMVYKILDELITLSYATKHDEPGAVARFEPAHPIALRSLIDRARSQVEYRHTTLENVLTHLISDFTAGANTPGVRLLQGINGIDELYEDILNERAPLCLLRSPYDDRFPELLSRVVTQIKNQVKNNIATRAITPFDNETLNELEHDDPKNLVTRRLIRLEKLDIPAQVLIYADKVAITAFDNELMTTIIQNETINKTFRLMFEFIWQAVSADDVEIRTGLRDGSITAPRPR